MNPKVITPARFPMHGGLDLAQPALTPPSAPVNLPIFPSYCVALNERPGLPAQPVVAVGQHVLRGELIAQQSHALNSPVHAPSSGVITQLHQSAPHQPITQIEIASDGEDQAQPQAHADVNALSSAECLARLTQAGVVGLGGAGFPLLAKVQRRAPHTLIVNAVECDPWQSADVSVLIHQLDAVLLGITALCRCWPGVQVILAVKALPSHTQASLQAHHCAPTLQVHSVSARYPSGGERQLVQQLLGQTLRPHQHSAELGILCCNLQTVVAAGAAVQANAPVISRVTTLAGEQLQWQGQVNLRNGTRAQDVLQWAGYQTSAAPVFINGLMMGQPLATRMQPLGKTTTALLAPSPTQWPTAPEPDPCIRCGACAEVCPEHLKPQELWRTLSASDHSAAAAYQLDACILCSACNWVCPSHIPLAQTFAQGQQHWHQHQAQQARAAQAQQRFEQRQLRLAATSAAQAERRARRAAQAAQRQVALPATNAQPAPSEATEALAAKLASAEQKLALATPAERKAMQMTVRKLQQQLARLQQEPPSDA